MIETERLILRPHSLDDLDASQALFSDPVVLRFLGGKPISREDMWNRLLRYAGHWALLGYGIFAIVERSSGELVGETGLADFHRGLGERFDPFPEAAWALASRVHGKGYALEAATAAHRWFDARHGASRTVCIIDAGNAASIGLARKLGYRAFDDTPYRDATVTMFERQRP